LDCQGWLATASRPPTLQDGLSSPRERCRCNTCLRAFGKGMHPETDQQSCDSAPTKANVETAKRRLHKRQSFFETANRAIPLEPSEGPPAHKHSLYPFGCSLHTYQHTYDLHDPQIVPVVVFPAAESSSSVVCACSRGQWHRKALHLCSHAVEGSAGCGAGVLWLLAGSTRAAGARGHPASAVPAPARSRNSLPCSLSMHRGPAVGARACSVDPSLDSSQLHSPHGKSLAPVTRTACKRAA